MIFVIMILNLFLVANDALRDNCIDRKPGIDYMRFHIPKWISFFGQQLLIFLLCIYAGLIPLKLESIIIGILYVISASVVWNIVYNNGEKDTPEGFGI